MAGNLDFDAARVLNEKSGDVYFVVDSEGTCRL